MKQKIALFQDGYLVLAGGRDENNDMLSSVEILNKDGGQWQSAVDMPTATTLHCHVSIADSFVVCRVMIYFHFTGWEEYIWW